MLRSLASNLLTVLIFGFFLIGAIGIWGKSQYVAEGPLQNAICFKVKSGTSMRTVVQDLVNDKAISSEFVFRVGMESSGLSRKIKAGSFLVPENASMAEISKRLTESGVSNCGNQIIYRVGVTSLKIEIRDTDPNTGKMVKVGDFIFDEAADEKINEFASEQIRVNAVCIGLIKSMQWVRRAGNKDPRDLYDEMAKRVPLGRVGEAEEYADLVAFLCSEKATFITGTAINLDGGMCPVV